MSDTIPTKISADRETSEVTIIWSDGATCVYPFDLLRDACPCAQCRDGQENIPPEPDENVFSIPLMDANISRMRKLEAVGSYAINIVWEDGHSHGIYNWRYLRSLCPSDWDPG